MSSVVDEDVGIGCHSGNRTDHVAWEEKKPVSSYWARPRTREKPNSFRMYSFSALVSCSNSLLVTLRSAARTMPSFANTPSAVPACEIASSAYSTWYRRPSGEKMVVWMDGERCQSRQPKYSEKLA